MTATGRARDHFDPPILVRHKPMLEDSLKPPRYASCPVETGGQFNSGPATVLTGLPRRIRRHDLRLIVPLADSTIYEMEKRGDFPRRFNLTPRCVVWDLEEVEAWPERRRQTYLEGQAKIAPGPDVHQRRTRPVKPTDGSAS